MQNPKKEMSTVRAKFVCLEVKEQPENEQKMITLTPVITGCEENKSFAKYTPSGHLTLNISNETPASEFFEVHKEYYLTFEKAGV